MRRMEVWRMRMMTRKMVGLGGDARRGWVTGDHSCGTGMYLGIKRRFGTA
jgi:hypothetical protein